LLSAILVAFLQKFFKNQELNGSEKADMVKNKSTIYIVLTDENLSANEGGASLYFVS
jgi:hypothetical protein